MQLLKKHIPISFGLAHFSLALVGLMWFLPFLYYRHNYPLSTFYQEWGAGLLGLGACSFMLTQRYWQAPEVPRIVLLPIGLLLLLTIQFFLGRVTHFDQIMLLSLYFLFAALMIMLGRALRFELGLPAMVIVLAMFLLLGAELNTLSGILQYYRWSTFLNPFIFTKNSSVVCGNIAQPNHYANYLALGLISLGLLYLRLSMRIWLVALFAAPMLFVMVLSASKSSLLYLLFAAGLAFLWQRRDKALRPVMYYSLALLVGFSLMHFVVKIPWLAGATANVTPVERLFNTASGVIRLHLWREAVHILGHFPLLGAGFGQFANQHLHLAMEMRYPNTSGLYTNAHNLVMQLAAETGLPGVAILLGTLGLCFWRSILRGAQYTLDHWWGYAILSVLGIHSLLEYPLWYSFFLGMAAVTLGMLDTTFYSLNLRNLGRASLAIILVLGVVYLLQVFNGYQRLEKALMLHVVAAKEHSEIPHARVLEELMAVYKSPLLSSYAELFIANTMEISADHLEQKLGLNERAMQFIPIAPVVYHQAFLLALSDKPEMAKTQIEQAIWAYPKNYPKALLELEDLARQDPARFSALLEFATNKIKEYRHAAIPKQ